MPSTPTEPRVSVIIPNWNGMALLRPCLDSLRTQTLRDHEVIVVDNGSTDGSVAALGREYPDVRVLALDANGGYTGGCNAGIRTARGSILVMLNNDTEADPRWLEALVAGLDRHPETGLAATRIMLFDRRDVLHSAGDTYGRNGVPDSRGVWQRYGPPYDRESLVFGACGGAMALRREMVAQIGLFEERLFMYCEDVDLAWRAQLTGWKCVYVPDAVVYHRLSATGGGTLSSYLVGRNTLWVLARNLPLTLRRRYARQILAAQWAIARDALRAWRGASARARLRGLIVGALTMGRWAATRRATLATRRVGDAYVESILS